MRDGPKVQKLRRETRERERRARHEEHIERIRERYDEIGQIIEDMFGETFKRSSEADRITAEEVLNLIIRLRKLRSRHLPIELFADPTWEMLLELKKCELTHQRVSVTSLCIASGAPGATALRHITKMTALGMIQRVPDRFDGRRIHLTLSKDASKALDCFLEGAAALVGKELH